MSILYLIYPPQRPAHSEESEFAKKGAGVPDDREIMKALDRQIKRWGRELRGQSFLLPEGYFDPYWPKIMRGVLNILQQRCGHRISYLDEAGGQKSEACKAWRLSTTSDGSWRPCWYCKIEEAPIGEMYGEFQPLR